MDDDGLTPTARVVGLVLCGTVYYAFVGALVASGAIYSMTPLTVAVVVPGVVPSAVMGFVHAIVLRIVLRKAVAFTMQRSGHATVLVFGTLVGAICGIVGGALIYHGWGYPFEDFTSGNLPLAAFFTVVGAICGSFFGGWGLKQLLPTLAPKTPKARRAGF